MSGWLVVNADDLGVSKGATLGILRAHREGIVTSASLAATTPFYAHAVKTCVHPCPDLGIGLHFTLTSGSPVSDPSRTPLLVNSDGHFRWRFSSLLMAAGIQRHRELLDQIGLELDAQYARLVRDGIRPDHINGERHVHLIPGIFERVAAAARRHGIRYVRAGYDAGTQFLTPHDMSHLITSGGFAKSWLLSYLSARARSYLGRDLMSPLRVLSYLHTGRLDLILANLLNASAQSGVTEVMVHPGVPEDNGPLDLGNREIERYLGSEDRRRELNACVAARACGSAWRLTNYRDLTRRGIE